MKVNKPRIYLRQWRWFFSFREGVVRQGLRFILGDQTETIRMGDGKRWCGWGEVYLFVSAVCVYFSTATKLELLVPNQQSIPNPPLAIGGSVRWRFDLGTSIRRDGLYKADQSGHRGTQLQLDRATRTSSSIYWAQLFTPQSKPINQCWPKHSFSKDVIVVWRQVSCPVT